MRKARRTSRALYALVVRHYRLVATASLHVYHDLHPPTLFLAPLGIVFTVSARDDLFAAQAVLGEVARDGHRAGGGEIEVVFPLPFGFGDRIGVGVAVDVNAMAGVGL